MKHLVLCAPLLLLAFTAAGHAAGVADVSDDLYAAIRANDLTRLRASVGTGATGNTKDRQGDTPLMYAAAVGSLEVMKYLIDKGADVNARNERGATPLIWAASQPAKVRLLLDHDANVNAATKDGRTALHVAAMSDGSAEIVRLLLARGADARAVDGGKTTTLVAATLGNDTDTIRMMIGAGVNVNAGNVVGLTPLMITAGFSGNLRATEALLAKSANVNAVSAPSIDPAESGPKAGPVQLGSMTPLLLASPFGPPSLIKRLIDAGADVNARDARGMTPLMLAIGTDRQDAASIRLLLERGADPHPRSKSGETAADWALKIGLPAGLELLKTTPRETAPGPAAASPADARTAVERSLALLQKSSAGFFEGSGCVSCHHQAITDMAAGEARSKGVQIDEQAFRERLRMATGYFSPDPLYERMDPPGAPEQTAYSLAGLAAMGFLPDRMTDAMAMNIAAAQAVNGAWHINVVARPPGEEGDIFRTALAVRALKVYAPPGRAFEIDQRIRRARGWLTAARPVTAEDRNIQLLGLYWSGADAGALKHLAQAIRAAQQPDGGWRQREGLSTDAYATGEALYALATAGSVSPREDAYQRGVAFLLQTQAPDGSWRVVSRAPKIQVYFNSGFPYGGDQWISCWATGWATMALAQAIEATARRAAR